MAGHQQGERWGEQQKKSRSLFLAGQQPDMDENIDWKPEYNTGVEEIDLQHQYFVHLINRLGRELGKPHDEKYVTRLLDELYRYATFHFLSEENIMMSMGYPELVEHQQAHHNLIEELSGKANFFKLSKISAGEFALFLKNWLLGHTSKYDQKISTYWSEQQQM